MVGKYEVVTLCGSTRFRDEFMEAQKKPASRLFIWSRLQQSKKHGTL